MRKVRRWAEWINCYEEKDLAAGTPTGMLFEEAKLMVAEDAKKGRDEGTCVLGAGITVNYVAKGARTPGSYFVTHAPFQGNVGSYRASQRALEFLKEKGVDARWDDGRMD